jgi:hypothetical protein
MSFVHTQKNQTPTHILRENDIMGIDSFHNYTDSRDMELIPTAEYKKIQEKAIKKLAGLPDISPDDFKELAEILGLDEELTWKPHLRLAT